MEHAHNLGITERILRSTIGLFLFLITLSKAAELPTWSFGLLVIISLAFLLTGLFGFCPVYAAIGRNTCEECAKHEHEKEKEEQPLAEEKLEEAKSKPKAEKRKKGKKRKTK